MLGHSLGEYTAACAAGLIDVADGLRLTAERGRLMASCASGAMISLAASEERVRDAIGARAVQIAGLNGPEATVISGEERAVFEVARELESQGVRARRLVVSTAFHSALMDPIRTVRSAGYALEPATPA